MIDEVISFQDFRFGGEGQDRGQKATLKGTFGYPSPEHIDV